MDMDTGADQEIGPRTATWLLPRLRMADAWVNIALAVLSGVLTGLAFPPFELWPLAWVALVPLLVALRRTTQWRFAGYLALLFGMSLCAVSLHWMTAIFGPLAVGVFFLASLPWLLFGLAYRTLCDRSQPWSVLLMTPVLWLAVDWIRCDGWYFEFSWLQLGFTVVPGEGGAHPVLYPLIGVYGVTFLIVLVNAALAIVLTKRDWRIPALAAGIIGIVLVVAGVRQHAPDYDLLHPKSYQGMIVQDESSNFDDLLRITRAELTPETRLVVWPEYAQAAYPLENKLIMKDLTDAARETHATFVFGSQEHAPKGTPCDWLRRRGMPDLYYNTAFVLSPQGEILGKYYKTHPIQFFADGVPGRSFHTIPSPVGRLGVAICYDFDYASTALTLVRNGAEVLVVPTMDATSWGETQHRQHTRMAQARTAEVGRYTLRATSSGISQILTPTGRPLASIPFGESKAAVANFTPMTTLTPYVRFTWLLPYLCLAAALCWALWVAVAAVRGRRKKAAI
ncbi:MAG: apolipoprotein N-acyltransferase [Armatimonadota bacterium]